MSIAQGVVRFIGYLRKRVKDAHVMSAYFTWEGTRVHGSKAIAIEIHPTENSAVWWYSVDAPSGYVFVRMPTVESCAHELVGRLAGESNPDARYWRWVAPERQGVLVSGDQEPPNLKVDFIVVGYQPQALVEHFSTPE